MAKIPKIPRRNQINTKSILIQLDSSQRPRLTDGYWGSTMRFNEISIIPWTPATMDMSLWLDASDETTITESSGSISNWADKSGNGNDAVQGTGANQPSTGVATIGGLNAISFDRDSSHFLSVPNDATLNFDGFGGLTIFAVVNYSDYVNAGSYINMIINKGNAVSSSDVYGFGITSGNKIRGFGGNDLSLIGLNNNSDKDTLVVIDSEPYSPNTKLYENGTNTDTDTAGTGTSDNTDDLYLAFDGGGGSRYATCRIGEIIICNGALLDSDRQKIEGYLAHKWNLTSDLPLDHPYKVYKPLYNWNSIYYSDVWNPPNDSYKFYTDAFVQDFSYAGYKRAEEPIPNISGTIYNVVTGYGADNTGTSDATVAIQNAIDAAELAGSGVVYLPAGTYKVSPQGANNYSLLISSSNIVLRGDGVGSTYIWNTATDMRSKSIIRVEGTESYSNSTNFAADVTGPSRFIQVVDASAYSAGDLVRLSFTFTDDWVVEHGQEAFWGTTSPLGTSPDPARFYRKVLSVDYGTNTIEIDVPTRYTMLTRDSALVEKMSGMISEVGLEDFSIGNTQNTTGGVAEGDYAVIGTTGYEVHGSYVIRLQECYDCWMSNVKTFQPTGNTYTCHILSNGFLASRCFQSTIKNCRFERCQYGGGGGNGYMYRLQQSNEILVTNCHSEYNRHGYVISHTGSSGNVWHQSTDVNTGIATGLIVGGAGYATSGGGSDHHQYLSPSNLVDNCSVEDSTFEMKHRGTNGSTIYHGLSTACSVMWNLVGSGTKYPYCAQTQQGRNGLIIGTSGSCSRVENADPDTNNTTPLDTVEGEGMGETLLPVSLYTDQLSKRL